MSEHSHSEITMILRSISHSARLVESYAERGRFEDAFSIVEDIQAEIDTVLKILNVELEP